MAAGEIYVKTAAARIYWRDSSDTEREEQGTSVGASGTPGSIWVETDYLHYVSGNGLEYRVLGSLVSTSKDPGEIYIGTDNYFYYASANSQLRRFI